MFQQLFSYFRLLSLDIVFGAAISTLFLAKQLDVILPNLVVIALGIAVWIIYTVDHLLDSSTSDVPLIRRHQFHQTNQKPLLFTLILMIVLGVVLVFQLPLPIIINGAIVAGCVVAYFVGLKIVGSRPSAYKEPLVALMYTMGVCLGPVSLVEKIDYLAVSLFFTIYALMAFANLMIFSVYELAIDEADQHTSLARYIGRKKATYLITICFIVLLILWYYQMQTLQGFDLFSMVLLAMITALGLVNYWKKLFNAKEWYRIVGDAIFYFPLLVLL